MSESDNNQTKRFNCETIDDIINSRILIVDDDELITTLLCQDLTNEGYEVAIATSFSNAQECLAQLHFNLIITDINLPDRSGEELLIYCKKNYKSTEIIIMTGDPHLDRAVQDIKDGAFDYLAKPISLELLHKRVKAALLQSKTSHNISPNTEDPLSDTGYSVVRTLGSGNMGVVLLVEKNKCYYAMKILRRDSKDTISELKVKRFIREAEILSKIDHPNIVKVLEFGMSGDEGVPYFVMEFIPSKPLNHYIAQKTLSINEKISIIRDIALALSVVHNEGILHRDIKPGNILITDDDHQVKLTDFGIARVSDSSITIPTEVLGSPAYMSPEAFDSSQIKDQRSDIFSLGTIAYELLTGQKPFNGDTIGEVMNEIRFNKPVEPLKIVPNLPPYLQDILAKMLAKKPEDRFSDAEKIVHALDHQSSNSSQREGITAKLLRTLILRKPTWK